jgi:hypothetical protein
MNACFHLPSVVCDNCAHLRSDTTRPVTRTWTSNTITTSGWQIPASMVPPLDSYTRQQVEAMLRVALTDRTDEWTIKSVDERVSILLAMFTKEKP